VEKVLKEYLGKTENGDSASFKCWDMAKKKIAKGAAHIWSNHVRARGKVRVNLYKSIARLEKTLAKSHPLDSRRDITLACYNEKKIDLERIVAEEDFLKEERSKAKWANIAGKPEKDFLRQGRPNRGKKRMFPMSISNEKDKPDLPHTDDPDIILGNFVKYYGELYKHKPVHYPTLDKLIQNLTITLDADEEEEMAKPISEGEILRAIMNSPNNKSPGSDTLPYECWKTEPVLMAKAMKGISARVTSRADQPASWRNIIISALNKVEDPYTTHLYRPISLLNTDYKTLMRCWADRGGPLLAAKLGEHQRGFIP
jgi:hypothetical protein